MITQAENECVSESVGEQIPDFIIPVQVTGYIAMGEEKEISSVFRGTAQISRHRPGKCSRPELNFW